MTTVAFMGYLGPLSSQGLNMYDARYRCRPGGGSAALHAARAGLSTLLLEADPEIGTPVHCGECLSELAVQTSTNCPTTSKPST